MWKSFFINIKTVVKIKIINNLLRLYIIYLQRYKKFTNSVNTF